MSFTIKTTTKVEDAANFITLSILNQLDLGKRVLFFVTGGSSISIVVKVAELLKEHPLENLTVMLTDERYGSINHPDSNWYKLIQKGFNLPQAKLIPILTGDNHTVTTEKFNTILNQEFKIAEYKIGLFGIGADGHTAGILPDSVAVNSEDLACGYDTPIFSRITITPKTIEKLDEAVVWMQGEEKWEVLKDLKEEDIPITKQPAQILKKVPLLTIFTDYEMKSNKTTYIIFGASGDLSRRYLMPAIKNLQNMKYVGTVVPVSRKDYGNLENLIKKNGEKIFHLAIPPESVPGVIEIISNNFGKDNIKIMLEKPFGNDLKSAQGLVQHIDKYFSEDQIYRVDHYLAKKSLENVITEKWDRNNIASIEIIASEKIDIEGRVNFYEQTGALKDFVQSHLLEMAAVVLAGSFEVVRRQEALKNLKIVCDIRKRECVKRGQYEGYREEVNNPNSTTETFVSINMVSIEPAWRGVSIVLSTGKAFHEKLTQIKIKYKDDSEKIFNIEHEPEAYERVIGATISGNHNLFISSDEIIETWRILDAIQKTWEKSKDDLIIYKKGSKIDEVAF